MDAWTDARRYEGYMGRWSRPLAREFVAWLGVYAEAAWLDVGCGTGALSEAILDDAAPSAVTAVDTSDAFVTAARERLAGRAFTAQVADATALPFAAASFDAVVSGLVLNFVADPARAAAELARVARRGASVGVYVWDYAGEMQLLRQFWDAAIAADERARAHDEGARFPICEPRALTALLAGAGVTRVEARGLTVPLRFTSFADLWEPFLGGTGPAPAYVTALDDAGRDHLRDTLRARLPALPDGSIALWARAWAVRGRMPVD
jgi:SAM-dependent methyltransferase